MKKLFILFLIFSKFIFSNEIDEKKEKKIEEIAKIISNSVYDKKINSIIIKLEIKSIEDDNLLKYLKSELSKKNIKIILENKENTIKEIENQNDEDLYKKPIRYGQFETSKFIIDLKPVNINILKKSNLVEQRKIECSYEIKNIEKAEIIDFDNFNEIFYQKEILSKGTIKNIKTLSISILLFSISFIFFIIWLIGERLSKKNLFLWIIFLILGLFTLYLKFNLLSFLIPLILLILILLIILIL